MEMSIDRIGNTETVSLSRPASPVAVIVVLMAVLLTLQTGVVIATWHVSIPLIVLLVAAVASAVWLALAALDEILPTRITLDRGGLKRSRLLADTSYDWHDVAAVKIVASSGTLSDDAGKDPAARLAVGLFFKPAKKKKPSTGTDDADVLLYGASSQYANELLKLVEHIDRFRLTDATGGPERSRRIGRAAPVAAPTAFRRPPTAAPRT